MRIVGVLDVSGKEERDDREKRGDEAEALPARSSPATTTMEDVACAAIRGEGMSEVYHVPATRVSVYLETTSGEFRVLTEYEGGPDREGAAGPRLCCGNSGLIEFGIHGVTKTVTMESVEVRADREPQNEARDAMWEEGVE